MTRAMGSVKTKESTIEKSEMPAKKISTKAKKRKAYYYYAGKESKAKKVARKSSKRKKSKPKAKKKRKSSSRFSATGISVSCVRQLSDRRPPAHS